MTGHDHVTQDATPTPDAAAPPEQTAQPDAPPPRPAPPRRRRRRGGSVLGRLLGFFGMILGIGALAGGGAIWLLFEHYGRDLPDEKHLLSYFPATTTRVYANDGRLLAEYAIERRVFVPITEIPDRVQKAFLAAEDQHFYSHPGIDPAGIVRATLANAQNMGTGRRPEGASTITQQVAKNFFLTNEASVARKLKEWVLAFRIEQTLPKDRILELYLNEIYLGFGAYGVGAAALNYFNKALDELTLGEAAYLAVLPKAPNNYHPINQKQRAIIRRNYVIDRMVEDGYVSAADAAIAKDEPLITRKRAPEATVKSEYFAEEIRRDLAQRYGETALYKGGLTVRATIDPTLQQLADTALREGLVSYDRRHGWRGPLARLSGGAPGSPLPANWLEQIKARPKPPVLPAWELAAVLKLEDQAVEIGLISGKTGRIPWSELTWARKAEADGRTGAPPRRAGDVVAVGDVILVEPLPLPVAAPPRRGQAPAAAPPPLVPLYGLRQIPEVSGALVAMDVHTGRVLAMSGGWSYELSEFNRATQALRQPGSSFKPYVFLAALNAGYTPATIVLDAPFTYDLGNGTKWRPSNYGGGKFNGPVPLATGLARSLNLVTARIAADPAVGFEAVALLAEHLGVGTNLPRVPAMVLGSLETTVLRQVTAYSMIANGGKRIAPTFIDRIQDHQGKTIYRHDTRPCEGCNGHDPGRVTPTLRDAREQVLDPHVAYQMVTMMQGVVEAGTGTGARIAGKTLAGKTGTTNDSIDAWFVGFSPDLAVGAYIGFDQPRTLGGDETGGRSVTPIFRAFMAEALKDKPGIPFRAPTGIRMVRVNAATGEAAGPGDSGVVTNAFRPGQEPVYGVGPATGPGGPSTTPTGGGTGVGGLY